MLGQVGASLGRWGRRVDANDISPALTVNQRSTGDIIDLQDGGVSVFKAADGGAITVGGAISVADDVLFKLGTDGDQVLLNKSAGLAADTALAGVLIGTVESQAIAVNSLMIANATSNGDIALYTNKGGHSQMGLWLDGSAGDSALLAASGASVDHYIAGVKELDHATGAFAFQVATVISGLSSIAAFAVDEQTVTFVAKDAVGGSQTVAQITGAATVANSRFDINKSGTITPSQNAAYNIGSSALRYSSIFVRDIDLFVSLVIGAGCLFKGLNQTDPGVPTTTQFPADKDWGIYKNTTSGVVSLVYNDGGVIKTVALA